MLAIAIITGIMTFITFGFIIGILAEGLPYPKVALAFTTIGFVLLGGIFIASALNAEAPCDYAEQKIVQGESKVCIPNHEVVDFLESNK